MSNADPMPEGTDQIIDGAGVGPDDDDSIAEQTIFTPDEDPTADDVRPDAPASDSPSTADAETAGAGKGGEQATGGASTTGAGFGSASLFERFDSLKSEGYDRARDFVQAGLDRAGSSIDDVVHMINDAADQIDGRVGGQYGDYARKTAESIGGFGETLRGKDVDALFAEARELVRKSPAIAIGSAAALGFVVARLARAGIPDAKSATRAGNGPA